MTTDESPVSQLPDIALRAMRLAELQLHLRLVDRAIHAAPRHAARRQQLVAYLNRVRAVWRARLRAGEELPGDGHRETP